MPTLVSKTGIAASALASLHSVHDPRNVLLFPSVRWKIIGGQEPRYLRSSNFEYSIYMEANIG